MRRIIFVEDDEEDMFLFDKAIHEIDSDLEIHYAVCGDDLFYLLRSSFPDLIFLDLNLPGTHGLDCLRKIRSMDHGLTPVIIFTNNGQQVFIDECFSAKANYYIVKPQNFEKLVETLKNALSLSWRNNTYPPKASFVL